MGFIKQNKVIEPLLNGSGSGSREMTMAQDEHERPIDEEHVQHAHRKAYEEDSAGSLPASSLGSAAAMQVGSISNYIVNSSIVQYDFRS